MVSELSINIDKTKMVKIGACRARILIWEGQYGLEWTSKFEALGIVFEVNDLSNITELNIKRKLQSMKNITKTWKYRSLTLYRKVAVIKSLVMSKITHLLLALPYLKKILTKELENFVSDFLWNKKTPRFRKEIIEAEIMEA